MKQVICLFLVFSCKVLLAQALLTDEISINPGGVIYDIAYDERNDFYVVVGDFISIKGKTRNNLAFIDGQDFSVLESDGFDSLDVIDGAIKSVEIIYNDPPPSPPFLSFCNIYLGGDFTQISSWGGPTYTRTGLALIKRFSGPSEWVSGSNFFIDSSFDPVLTYYGAPPIPGTTLGITDIAASGDSLFVTGDFETIENTWGFDHYTYGVGALNRFNGTAFTGFTFDGTDLQPEFYQIELSGTSIYIAGNRSLVTSWSGTIDRIDYNGDTDPSYTYFVDQDVCEYGFTIFNDSVLISNLDQHTEDFDPENVRTTNLADGSDLFGHPMSFLMTSSNQIQSLASYKNDVYICSNDLPGRIQSYDAYPSTGTSSDIKWEANCNAFTTNKLGNLKVVNNLLFISSENLSSVDGTARNGFTAFCLPPADAQSFTAYDTTICPDDIITYTIPEAEYADGYIWEFDGDGLTLGAGFDTVLVDTFDASGFSIPIKFLFPYTPGTLTVTPFSNCGGNLQDPSNLQKSNPVSIFIDTNPLPNANAGQDTTLNCQRDSVVLIGSSSTPSVTYEWQQDFAPHTPGADTTIFSAETFIFKVTDPIGCPNYDTVVVTMDTIKPPVILPAGPFTLTCADTVRNLLGSTSILDTLIQWRNVGTNALFSNPYTTSALGEHRLIVTDTSNGCSDSLAIFMALDQTPPNITVLGYPDLASGGYLDTINCFNPVLNLTANSDSSNTVITWCDSDSTNFIGVDTALISGGWYYMYAIDTVKGCTNFGQILIFEDFNSPDIAIDPVTALNCSNDSLVLHASSLVGDTIIWSGGSITSSTNPISIYDAGMYFSTTIDSLNGCERSDSVLIEADNSIDVYTSNDTVGCRNDLVLMTANYGGAISGITYAWNNGETSPTAFYTAGVDSLAVVEINGDGGCYGTDTIRISTPPVPDINFTGYQPCGNGATGQIIGEPLSGWAPFQYSINDGVSFQTSPVFTGLDFGDYVVWAKDSLGCNYEFTASISQSSALPEPSFLVSTYNYSSDTVVIIDISNPPTDSSYWDFPLDVEVIDSSAVSPVLILPDTGVFEITMHALYGSCEVVLSKIIYATEWDSTAATAYNQNGIESVELFPNPTNGEFTINVSFFKAQNAAITVQDMLGYPYEFYTYDHVDSINEFVLLDGTAINGTYVVKVVGEYDSAYITFILSK